MEIFLKAFLVASRGEKTSEEEKDIVHRLRPFARLQTAEDYEDFSTDILCT